MFRSRLAEATLIGCLTALASFCAFNAQGSENYSIVAQSSRSSAATGRRPLAERIAASNLPIITRTAASSPAIPPRGPVRQDTGGAAEGAANTENMAVSAVRVDQQETIAPAPPPRPAATPPVLWPFGTKRPEAMAQRPAAPAKQPLAKARTSQTPGREPVRQANARPSGNGVSGSRPASVTR
jgi:hypothetical protein